MLAASNFSPFVRANKAIGVCLELAVVSGSRITSDNRTTDGVGALMGMSTSHF